MRILILSDSVWNDYVFGNGVLTNWFTGFDAEFAQIYLSPGLPNNNICERYFQITDIDMLKSIIGKRAGKAHNKGTDNSSQMESQYQGGYKYLKKVSTLIHTPMMMIQDAIWSLGRYNELALKDFIDDFQPDIIFTSRLATPRLLRFEKLVHRLCDRPIVAFTGDKEIGFNCYSLSPLFWIRRFYTTKMFEKNRKIYSHYFAHSKEQIQLYKQKYGIPSSILFKCSAIAENTHISNVNMPIRLVYAGNLYCNRWKTLAAIGRALKIINQQNEKIRLDIYTMDSLTNKQKKVLNEDYSIYVKGGVTPLELKKIYNNTDIALHVESFDRANKLATEYSFSTKIIDLLSSGCAVMAICWDQQTGFRYLLEQDAAICISSYDDIQTTLLTLLDKPKLIQDYAKKAMTCAKKNHSIEVVHKQLRDTFKSVIESN